MEVDTSTRRLEFLNAMRGIAHSVGVVTTGDAEVSHGATVSSYCSVSADPPAILICLRADSRIAEAVLGNRGFCLNVLPEYQCEVANRFAGQDDHYIPHRFADMADRWDFSAPSPILKDSTWLSCINVENYRFATHVIVIGAVHASQSGPSSPLLYMNGGYRRFTTTEKVRTSSLKKRREIRP